MQRFITVFVGFIVFFCSCRTVPVASELQLTNSREDSTGLFKPVFQIGGTILVESKPKLLTCTATAVSFNSALTAAHCVQKFGQLIGDIRIIAGEEHLINLRPKEERGIIVHPNYSENPIANDLAALVFDGEPFRTAYVSISKEPANPGDRVSIIGYGKKDHSVEKSGGGRHYGVNDISSKNVKGDSATLDFYGHPHYVGQSEDGKPVYVDYQSSDQHVAAGLKVGASHGDSGGPMLRAGLLVGVASSIDKELSKDGMIHAHYEYLLSKNALGFLHNLVEMRIAVSGIHGNLDDIRKMPTPQDLEDAILDNVAIKPNPDFRGTGEREFLNTKCVCTRTDEECRLDVVDDRGHKILDLASDDPSACSEEGYCERNFADQYARICREIRRARLP